MRPTNEARPATRRVFLLTSSAATAVTALGGVLGGGGASGCAGHGGAPPPGGVIDTGLTVADLAVGQCVTPAGAAFVLARDATGFYAYSNRCTHEQCTIPCPDAGGVSQCPCHGAEFDANGNNLLPNQGASGNLPDLVHYPVQFNGTGDTARVVVDTSTTESDRTARAAPPPVSTSAAG